MPRISQIELFQQVRQPILSIRNTVTLADLPKNIGAGFTQLAEYSHAQQVLVTDIPFVIYHDYQRMNENYIDVEVVIPVKDSYDGSERIKPSFLPESKYISCMYQGSYAETGPVYEEMAKWITEKGLKIKGDCYECYYNGVEYPESMLLTKIVIPVE